MNLVPSQPVHLAGVLLPICWSRSCKNCRSAPAACRKRLALHQPATPVSSPTSAPRHGALITVNRISAGFLRNTREGLGDRCVPP
jgi:hypothetical protein